jgi:hypothetical protein
MSLQGSTRKANSDKSPAKTDGLYECSLTHDAVAGRTTLRLNGADYDVGKTPGGYWFAQRHKKGVPVRRTVTYGLDGVPRCDCPAAWFHGSRPCKHKLAVATRILKNLVDAEEGQG